jgi:hypothetical protein
MNNNMEKSVSSNESSVSRLAYQLWERAGRPAGRDLEFWLSAEQQLRAATTPRVAASVSETLSNVGAKDTASKTPRAARSSGAKKSWPKPYPNLPKF